MPTPQRILDLSWGLARPATLVAALDLDVFGAIDAGHDDIASIAQSCGASERGVAALVDGLVSFGLVAVDAAGGDRLAPDAAAFLVPGSPRYLGDVRFLHHELNFRVWPQLAEAVRQGSAPQELFAVDASSVWAQVTPYLDALGAGAVGWMAPQLAG